MNVVCSNQIDALISSLKQNLFQSNKHPLLRKIVVVQNAFVKRQIQLSFFKTFGLKVVTGVKFIELNEAVVHLNKLFFKKELHFPSKSLLALEIKEMIKERSDSPSFSKVKDYVAGSQKRLDSLSSKLALEFLKVGKYAGDKFHLIEEGFEKELFLALCIKWNYPYELLDGLFLQDENGEHRYLESCDPKSKDVNQVLGKIEIHIFSIPFISALYQKFFNALENQLANITYYYQNPSMLYWGDLLADKEKAFLQAKDKGFIPFLEDIHPLLANWGRLGRENFSYFEEAFLEENFIENEEGHLLGKIKNDILLQRLPYRLVEDEKELEGESKSKGIKKLEGESGSIDIKDLENENGSIDADAIECVSETVVAKALEDGRKIEKNNSLSENGVVDASISFHKVHTKIEEVEVVLSMIRHYLALGDTPSDFLVVASDISKYVDIISFLANDLPFEIHGVDLLSTNHSVEAFFQLFAIREERFSLDSVLRFISFKPVRRKWGISTNDLKTIESWFEKFLVKWGVDRSHRESVLETKLQSKDSTGTFDHAFKALTYHLVTEIESPVLDFVHVDLLETLLILIRTLHKDLSKKEISLTEFEKILEDHFLFVAEDKVLTDKILREKNALELIEKKLFSFEDLKEYFLEIFTKKTASCHAKEVGNIPFITLSMGLCFSTKHIFMLGAEDGVFPRTPKKEPISILEKHLDPLPYPSIEDRWSFLELLLASKESVHYFFQENPSALLLELKSYVLENYQIDLLINEHPLAAFYGERYYENKPFIFSSNKYALLKKVYENEEEDHLSFFPEFQKRDREEESLKKDKSSSLCNLEKKDLEHSIDIKSLGNFAKNPIKYYLQNSLKMYFPNTQEKGHEFILSALDKGLLRSFFLKEDLQTIVNKAESSGLLPGSVYKEIALKRLKEDVYQIENTLDSFQIKKEDIFTLLLRRNSEIAEEVRDMESCYKNRERSSTDSQKSKREIVENSLTVRFTDTDVYHIEGKIENVTRNGLLFYGDKTIANIIKVWPKLILLHLLDTAIKKRVIFLKDGKSFSIDLENPLEEIKKYIRYFEKAQNTPSMLHPDWIKCFIDSDDAALIKKIQATCEIDESIAYCFKKSEDISSKKIIDHFRKTLQDTFTKVEEWV